jgi:poly-gamma-glutamate system protein
MSSVTSKPADLATKQLSLHPLFASAAVQLLADAGVKQGDAIAVGWTGSFPGLNLALCAAIEAMELRPIIVASVMASQYGANEPTYAWLDMERTLYEAGLIGFRSGAATIGGPADRGWGMPAESLLSARTAMDRNQITPLHANDLAGSIEARMEYYRRRTDGQQVAVYVNVGGGRASAGGAAGKSLLQAGLNLTSKKTADGLADCVMGRFLAAGTPVIHLAQVADLARQFGLSATEQSWQSPPDSVVAARAPSRFAACLALLVILAVLRAFILTDIGRQFFGELMHKTTGHFRPSLRILRSAGGPELMV